MCSSRLRRLAAACCPALFIILLIATLQQVVAAADASLTGRVVDQLGAPIAAATVTLIRDGQRASDTTSDARGEFAFASLAPGRYQIQVRAQDRFGRFERGTVRRMTSISGG